MDIERLKELQIAKQVLLLNKSVLEYELAQSKDDQDFIDAVEIAVALIDAEIARQSVKSEDVAEAIEYIRSVKGCLNDVVCHQDPKTYESLNLAITALQAYQPTTRKDRIVEEVQEAIEYYKSHLAERLHDGKDEVTKRFETVITALQSYQPWIPVSNVKPEKSGRYISYVPEHWTDEGHKEGKVIIAYFRELNYEGRRRVWDDGAYGISGEVTHYLPLPEPPKGE